MAVLEKKNSLPCPKNHFPLGDRHNLARAGESHSDVGCHVIRSLKGMGVVISILGNLPLKETFQIPRSRGVRIFKNHKARARMPNKNSNHALPNQCAQQGSLHLLSDFIEPLAARRDIKKTSL